MNEINEECLEADFITYDNELETRQTYDSASILEEEEIQNVQHDDNDGGETSG